MKGYGSKRKIIIIYFVLVEIPNLFLIYFVWGEWNPQPHKRMSLGEGDITVPNAQWITIIIVKNVISKFIWNDDGDHDNL